MAVTEQDWLQAQYSVLGAALIEPVNRKLPDYAFAHKLVPLPPVVAAMLGNDAGIIGAAFLDTME